MMKLILMIFLFVQITFAQSEPLMILMDDGASQAQVLADAYVARVVADGGSIIDETAVLAAIEDAIENLYWDSVQHWSSAYFGIKETSPGVINTLYCLKGNDIATDGVNEPVRTEDSLNSKASLVFTSDPMTGTISVTGDANLTFVNVAKFWSLGASSMILTSYGIDNNNFGMGYHASNYFLLFQWGSGEATETTTDFDPHIFIGSRTGSVSTLYVDNVLGDANGSLAAINATTGNIRVGGHVQAGIPALANISETIILSPILSTAKRTIIYNFLKTKYGL